MDLKWIAQQVAYDAYSRVLDVLPDSLLKRNARFRNLHRDQRCFLLGSGPSIREQDLTKLNGQIVMTQNHFHAHEQIRTIAPTYHVVVPKYQPVEFDDDWVAWLRSMDERLPGDTTLFFGKNTKYLVDRLGLFGNRAYYMKTGLSAVVPGRAPFDITRTIFGVPTVLTQCLAIAIYMGFREIVLLGFDLDQVCRISGPDEAPLLRNVSGHRQQGGGGRGKIFRYLRQRLDPDVDDLAAVQPAPGRG